MTKHKTIKMRPYFFESDKEIDAGIAELMAAIWQHKFLTWSCCEENEPGMMIITFIFGLYADEFIKFCQDLIDARWKIKGGLIHLWGETVPLISVIFPREQYPAILDKVRNS